MTLQSQASSAGRYYFRCPVCNDKETFCTEMSRIGISIPDRDAKWEVGTNYFEELRCNAEVCSCPQGRSYHAQIGYVMGTVKYDMEGGQHYRQ